MTFHIVILKGDDSGYNYTKWDGFLVEQSSALENMIHKVPQINNWPQCAYFAKNGRFQIDLQHELCKAELNHVTF